MTVQDCVRSADAVLDSLQSLDARAAATMERAALAQWLQPAIAVLQEAPDAKRAFAIADAALRSTCPALHTGSRAREALALAREVLNFARARHDVVLERRASSMCGIFLADLGDPVAAIEHQVNALRLSGEDHVAAARAWSNIGLAMVVAGQPVMAVRCFERALAGLEGTAGPADARYVALLNLAQMQLETGDYEDGLVSAYLALNAEGAIAKPDPMGMLRLRRNVVRLLVAVGRVDDAEPHMLDAMVLAKRVGTPRALIAGSLTTAVYELARGESDVGLTRLDSVLMQAREMPALLRDTLASVVRAEEMAGHSARALMRLRELCEVQHVSAVAAARQHVELASVADRGHDSGHGEAQARARLIAKLDTPRPPDGWRALERLAVTAAVRIEPSGLHGKRVGALARGLAVADGADPLQALEIGFACELHDIGMVSVPEELLSKAVLPRELEQSIIERHVRAGAEILTGDDHPRIFLAREVARYHHAHWDGSGHPADVAAARIPYAARICAIADAYDEMVSGSRGSTPLRMDAGLRYLRAQAGKRYDPQLVERFESMIRAESDDLGLDMAAATGMDNFQQLVSALQEDRGFA